jgi:hypothetical protein
VLLLLALPLPLQHAVSAAEAHLPQLPPVQNGAQGGEQQLTAQAVQRLRAACFAGDAMQMLCLVAADLVFSNI